MSKFLKTTITTLVVIIGIAFVVGGADAAILSVDPPQKELALGETFLADVHLNSEQQVINAVEAVVTYPTDMLEVIEVSQGGSFLTLWVQEPAVEKTAGIISLVGGIPDGSYVVDGKVITITFKTKAAGGVEVGFDSDATSVRLNDGKGTEAPLTLASGIYKISTASFISIASPTHPDEDTWYKNKTFTVSWSIKQGANYSYALSVDPDEVPDEKSESTKGEVTFPDLSDGIYYFVLKEKLPNQDWEVVGKRRVMIDSRSPMPIEAYISQESTLFEGKYFLIFSTVDKTSGVDHYDIIEGKELFGNASSPYVLKDQSQSKSITIRAFDRAGNSTEFSFAGTSESTTLSINSYTLIIIVCIVLVIFVLLFAFGVRLRK
jgi:hypothetical protein